MSLEDTIQGLTDAVNALNATLQSARLGVPAPAPEAAPEVPPAPKSRPKADKPAPTATATSEPKATTATTDSPETTSTQATTAGISYDTVAKAITDTFTKDRAKVFAALAKFNAKKGPELKPADYAAFLEELV